MTRRHYIYVLLTGTVYIQYSQGLYIHITRRHCFYTLLTEAVYRHNVYQTLVGTTYTTTRLAGSIHITRRHSTYDSQTLYISPHITRGQCIYMHYSQAVYILLAGTICI